MRTWCARINRMKFWLMACLGLSISCAFGAPPAERKLPPKLTDGFEGTAWGTRREEVLGKWGALRETTGAMDVTWTEVYYGEIDGGRRVAMGFVEGKLVGVEEYFASSVDAAKITAQLKRDYGGSEVYVNSLGAVRIADILITFLPKGIRYELFDAVRLEKRKEPIADPFQ